MENSSHERRTLKTEKWVQNGLCIGRNPDNPRTVFIHGSLPGERIEAEILKERSGHDFALTLSVENSSPDRIESDCSAFPECGGCSFRHISYEKEKEIKRALLSDLNQIRDFVLPLNPTFHESPPDGYRLHVQIQSDGLRAGFFKLHTNTIVPFPLERCRHLAPELNEQILTELPLNQKGRFRFRLSSRSGTEYSASPSKESEKSAEEDWLESRIEGTSMDFSWGHSKEGFFQNNRFLTGPWLETLRSWIPSGRPDTVELFSGSGIIGGYGRDLLGNYTGIDGEKSLIRAARRNFQNRNFPGKFLVRDLYRSVPGVHSVSLGIVNPPRGGLNRPLQKYFLSDNIDTILYSSCNPHTLNRDLDPLIRGGFSVDRAAIFDFFPRTPHLEMAVRLIRN